MGFVNPIFSMPSQQQSDWCWAAITTAVGQFPPPLPPASQCDIVTAILRAEAEIGASLSCCATPAACNMAFSLRLALCRTQRLRQFLNKQVTFEVIEAEIDEHERPVCARIVWNGDERFAHFVVIYGCERRNGVPYVWVKDPDPGGLDEDTFLATPPESNSVDLPFEQFRDQYRRSGIWRQTYLLTLRELSNETDCT